MIRKTLFWMHLIAGTVAGLIILIMSVTGVLLTYEKQMLAWADRNYRTGPPSAATPRLNVEALVAKVQADSGIVPTNVTLRSDPQEPVLLALGERGNVYANAYTGELLGAQSTGMRLFFRKVTDWHRWLGVGTESGPDARTNARRITGASNLAFLFIVMSGLVLWFPRKLRWQNFKAVLWFRGGLAGKARDFNWHNVIGFWCLVPLFFVVLSAVVISYPWASNMVYQAYGMQPPAGKGKAKGGAPKGGEKGKGAAKGGPRGERGERGAPQPVDLTGMNALIARASQRVPEWRTLAFAVPNNPRQPVTFNIDAGTGGQPQLRATLALDRETGAVRSFEDWNAQEPGRRARSWMRFVHTGEYYGVIGQTVAGMVSLGGAFLVWTGIALALRRFNRWKKRRSGKPQPDQEEVLVES